MMDFDKVERQKSGWVRKQGAIYSTMESVVLASDFDALLAAYKEMKQSLIDTLEE